MQNDVPFIMKNIKQMNDYVNKRRKAIKKKTEEENYKKRRGGKDVLKLKELVQFSYQPMIKYKMIK